MLSIDAVAKGLSNALLVEPEQHGLGRAGRVPAHHVPRRHPVLDVRCAAPQDRRQVGRRARCTC